MKKGFTLIELLVVISIIGLLSSVVLASLNVAKSKARDSQRKQTLRQLVTASELYYNTNGFYAPTIGDFTNVPANNNYFAPAYISALSADPGGNGGRIYQYWRKDYPSTGYSCMTLNNASKYGFYAKLENPSAADLATVAVDSFDQCVATLWGMNYKAGNN